jgi:hypothetical protein
MNTYNQGNSERTLQVIKASALALVVMWVAGCNSTGYKQSDAAAYSMQTAAGEVQAESRALELTMGALKDLVNEPPANLQQQFKHFSASLNRLVAAAQRTENTARRMELKSAAYFQNWDKQLAMIDYEHIRNLSQTRRTAVTNTYETVHHRYQETQAVVQPLIAYLQDIRRALDADLTVGGLEAMKSVVVNADQNAVKVQTALAALASELNNSSTRMSSIVLQTAQPQTNDSPPPQ